MSWLFLICGIFIVATLTSCRANEILQKCQVAAARKDVDGVGRYHSALLERAQKSNLAQDWFDFGRCLFAMNHPKCEDAFDVAIKIKPGAYEAQSYIMVASLRKVFGNITGCMHFAKLALKRKKLKAELRSKALKLHGSCAVQSGDSERVARGVKTLAKLVSGSQGEDHRMEAGRLLMEWVPDQYALGRSWMMSGADNTSAHDLLYVGNALMLLGQNESDDVVRDWLFRAQSVSAAGRDIVRDWSSANVDVAEVARDKAAYGQTLLASGEELRYAAGAVSHVVIRNARLEGRYGIIRDSDDRYLLPSYDYLLPLEMQDEHVQDFGRLELELVDEAFSGMPLFCENYGDFLINGLTRLVYLTSLKPNLKVILCSRDGELMSFMSDVVKLLGLPGERIIHFTGHGKSLPVRSLHLIDWTPKGRHGSVGAPHLPPKVALQRVRDVIGELAVPRHLVFIRRSNETNMRRAPEVEAKLQKAAKGWLKFIVHKSEPLHETVKLFGACLVAVGPHGAGLSNAVFMPEGSHLVELSLPQSHAIYFAHLAIAMGLNYWPIPVMGHAHLQSSEVRVKDEVLHNTLQLIRSHMEL